MSITTEPETALSDLVGHDPVMVVTVDRETCWRPRSPFDVPRAARQVAGMPVRLMPLAELVEYNTTAMRTGGRFWRLCPEMLDGQLGQRDAMAGDPVPSTDAETSDNGRERTTEASAADTGDGRGDRCVTPGSAGRQITRSAFRLLGRLTAELSGSVFDQAAVIASARAGTGACIEAEDIRRAVDCIADVGTRRRIRWQSIDVDMEGGA